MKRASYREAVQWIAFNDNAGNGDTQEEVAMYITVLLIADIFDVEPDKVASDVCKVREKELKSL